MRCSTWSRPPEWWRPSPAGGISGFDDPKVPANLMQVEVPVVSLKTCQQAYGDRGGVIDIARSAPANERGARIPAAATAEGRSWCAPPTEDTRRSA